MVGPASATSVVQFGRFELLTRIAKGGMAEIFLARQAGIPGFERLVVVKKILPHLAEEPEFVRMFTEEARLAALISHPNVVQIFDVGCHDGEYFIAMEYIPGMTLAAMCRKARKDERPISVPAALEIVAQACDGLDCAHQLRDMSGAPLGVVHRDISPQNLMVTSGGIVKIVDFGIAKATVGSRGTEVGTLKGKFPYMSPEQVRAEQLDPRSDLFSLGTLSYELLTGRSPFDRPSELQVLQSIVLEDLPRPSAVLSRIPPFVDALVVRAMAKDRDKRFQTAAEMAQKTRVVLEETGSRSSPEILKSEIASRFADLITAERTAVEDAVSSVRTARFTPAMHEAETRLEPSGPAVAARTARRRRLARLGGVLVVLLALVVGVVVLISNRRPSPRADPRQGTSPPEPSYPGPPLRLGLVPYLTRDVVQRELDPLRRFLGRKLERRFQLTIGSSYEDVTRMLLGGSVDLAQLQPLQYVRAKQRDPRVRLLATQTYEGSTSYEGYMVTRDDSHIETPADLAGRRFCYVEEGSTSGYLIPRTYLRRHLLDPDRLFSETRMSGDHMNVMRDVLGGRCDAGAVYSGALLAARDLGLSAGRLRVIAVTGRLPYDAVCAGPGLPAAAGDRIRDALVGLDVRREFGTPFLGQTIRVSGFVSGDDAAFASVREALAMEEGEP
ncbi:MAG: phosphate/phosphite/phosphonate ABC transporter substrate-binding protein [Deltaproteobacteria bacterium]|nr:phosphate/phosphite/phosphonate ABC transporter substrate-binding protein [Deltaproteobacteria bacterium]